MEGSRRDQLSLAYETTSNLWYVISTIDNDRPKNLSPVEGDCLSVLLNAKNYLTVLLGHDEAFWEVLVGHDQTFWKYGSIDSFDSQKHIEALKSRYPEPLRNTIIREADYAHNVLLGTKGLTGNDEFKDLFNTNAWSKVRLYDAFIRKGE